MKAKNSDLWPQREDRYSEDLTKCVRIAATILLVRLRVDHPWGLPGVLFYYLCNLIGCDGSRSLCSLGSAHVLGCQLYYGYLICTVFR